MTQIIARTTIELELEAGVRKRLHIEIHQPELTEHGSWRCAARIAGLHDELHPVEGEDSVQALTLALGLVKRLLQAQRSAGRRLLMADDDDGDDIDFPLDAYFPSDSQKRAV